MVYKVYDLTKGDVFAPLPLATSHRKSLRRQILNAVCKVPDGIRTCLSYYSPEPTTWDIPPLYTGTYKGVSLQVSCNGGLRDKNLIPAEYVAAVRAFSKYGYNNRLMNMLRLRFDNFVDTDFVFDKQNTDPAKFALEYIIALTRSYQRALIMSEASCFLQVDHRGQSLAMGILEGKVYLSEEEVIGETTPAEMYGWLLSGRGTVTTDFFGAYDRLRLWALTCFSEIDDVDKFIVALSLLKLCGRHDEEVAFEQTIRAARGLTIQEACAVKFEGSWNLDDLDEIRAMWYESDKSLYEIYTELMSAIVPRYLDSPKFSKMFGKLPDPDVPMSNKDYLRIDRGIQRFALYFTEQNRKTSGI